MLAKKSELNSPLVSAKLVLKKKLYVHRSINWMSVLGRLPFWPAYSLDSYKVD